MKIIVVDVETNGLFGAPFAVGAVVFDTDTQGTLTAFSGRGPIIGEVDTFVLEKVIHAVSDLPQFISNAQLRVAFWQWFTAHKDGCKIFADVAYPVEAQWFRLCQEDMGVTWGGPYPLHDVATLLLACGVDDNIKRVEYAGNPMGDEFKDHNPLHDATISAHVVSRLLRQLKANVKMDEAFTSEEIPSTNSAN